MNITPIIFFDMVAAILILALALIVIVLYLFKMTKTLHASLNLKNEAFQKNADLLEEVRTKAIAIIDEANNQALDIVNKVTLSTDSTSDKFKENLAHISAAQIKEFEKTTSDFIKTYGQILQDLKTKNVEVFQKVSKDIEINTEEEIGSFKESMQKLTTLSQNEVRKKIDTEYKDLMKEIETYKKTELQKVDSSIYGFLEKMSKLVLGKVLNLSEHEDLIEKSLEQATKEGVFK
jgi:hypothetical protein